MSATQEMMKVVVAAFAPTLKAAGYRKQGARFREEVSHTVVRLVNIQSSPWNMGSEGQFTVNLGVYHRDFEVALRRLSGCRFAACPTL